MAVEEAVTEAEEVASEVEIEVDSEEEIEVASVEAASVAVTEVVSVVAIEAASVVVAVEEEASIPKERTNVKEISWLSRVERKHFEE